MAKWWIYKNEEKKTLIILVDTRDKGNIALQ
jgi:hypothetical protein